MGERRRRRSTVTCPHCGGALAFGRLACPHCGSDMETGWRDDDDDFDTGLVVPDHYGDDEYTRFVTEMSGRRPALTPRQQFTLVVGLLLVAALVATLVF